MQTSTIIEIELKYQVREEALVRQLLSLREVGPYRVGEFSTDEIIDTYLDTPSQRFFIAQYAFRYRQDDTGGCVQLKSLGRTAGARHQRAELRAQTDHPTRPDVWPEGLARQLALEILDHETPVELFSIRQIRHTAPLIAADQRRVACVSIDEVTWVLPQSEHRAWELEVELLEAGREEDLRIIQSHLATLGGLQPAHSSKFERGLRLLRGSSQPKQMDVHV
ncbi:MAG: CYTH domain-containing protein [Caldilineae bacterium]|nr:MAG: CYTH domain-containing protein [Caldilineae bacterium]